MKRIIAGMWVAAVALAAGMAGRVEAADTNYWRCPTNNGLWSATANWSLGHAPQTGEHVVFDAVSNFNCTADVVSNDLGSLTLSAGYSSTVSVKTVYQPTGFTNFTIAGDCTIMGGVLTHLPNTGGETNRLRVTVGGNLLVTNATISADSCGYAGGKGPGYQGNNTYGSYHGGAGAGSPIGTPAFIYGSITAPTNLGSGSGTAGGGAIWLTVAGTTTVAAAGIISASSVIDGWAGGSGGSIYLTTGRLAGNGTIRANGRGLSWGGGGGGRVALVLTDTGADFSSWTGTNIAYGGVYGTVPADANGAAGTVYRRAGNGTNELIIDNGNTLAYPPVVTFMPVGTDLMAFSNVVIRKKGMLGIVGDTVVDFATFAPTVYGPTNSYIAIHADTNVTCPTDWTVNGYTLLANAVTPGKVTNLTIGTNGVLSHYQNWTSEVYKLNLTLAGNLTVLSNGAVSANGRGYGGGKGPGTWSGDNNVGGAYGGTGRRNNATTPVPVNTNTYGSIVAPTNLGSGAGAGGFAGGAVLLTVAGTTTVASAGIISADGVLNGWGSPAGGSVRLVTGWLTGAGTIRANGADSGGGGGRVSIVLTNAGADFSSWTGTNVALGGGGTYPAAAGTVYRQAAGIAAGAGTVIVSNGVATLADVTTHVPANKNPTEDLKASRWIVTGYGKLGITADAQLGTLTVTGANARVDLRGRKLSVLPDLNLNGTLYGVGTYTTNQLAGGFVVDSVGGGVLEVRPMVDNATGATNVTTTGATLNGNLYAGDASTALFVLWGPRDAGTNLAQWAHTNIWPAPQAAGLFSTNVTAPDLLANTVQYYRFYMTNSSGPMLASTSSVFMTCAVTVQKTADASEAGLAPGTFTFYRHADATNGAVTVSYGIGGTAKPGTNYVNNLGTNITFAEGVSQTNLTVTPLQDDVSQTNETIIVTLAAGPYLLGSPAVATGLVVNASYPGAPTNTWIGTGNASQGTNWSLAHAPSAGEDVLLSGFSKANVIWDLTNAVASWRQTEQYTGTVTVQTVYGTTGFTHLAIAGDCTIMGGAWTHLANTGGETNRLRVTVGGNLLVTNATISADSCGYAGGKGPGYQGNNTYGSYHGGAGAGNPIGNPALIYGSITAPPTWEAAAAAPAVGRSGSPWRGPQRWRPRGSFLPIASLMAGQAVPAAAST